MAVTIRRVLTNVRRHARSLLPPSKDIRKTGRKGFRKHALVSALVLGFLRGIVTERGLERYLNEHGMEARLCDLQAKPSDTTLGRVKRWLAPEVLEQLLSIIGDLRLTLINKLFGNFLKPYSPVSKAQESNNFLDFFHRSFS